VSVNETQYNPYYNLYNESDGYIHRSIPSNFTRRQDCPVTYVVNGSIYVISTTAIKKQPLHQFEKVKKYVIPEKYGLDLDTLEDWKKAELMFENE
jgi:N-acylneuraminate cytidylyltransferase